MTNSLMFCEYLPHQYW